MVFVTKKWRSKMIVRVCWASFVALSFIAFTSELVGDDQHARESVVRVVATQRIPHWIHPWRGQTPQRVSGTGTVIPDNRILTNAHLVRYASQIDVQASDSSELLPAKVVSIAHGMDLAVLTVDDDEFFQSRPALAPRQDLPKANDRVSVLGYATGGVGLAITQGTVSRINLGTYDYGETGLQIEITAAVGPGNSGGPVLVDGRMIGTVVGYTAAGQNTGLVVPGEEILAALDDLEDGRYDGKPTFDHEVQALRNPALRSSLGVGPKIHGVLIRNPHHSTGSTSLQEGDVIVAIGDHAIDDVGMVRIDEHLRVDFTYLVPKLTHKGEIPLKIWRDGHEIVVHDQTRRPDVSLFRYLEGRQPSYFVWGPLAFSPATAELVAALQAVAPQLPALWTVQRSPLVIREEAAFEDEELVVVTAMFPHRICDGYQNATGQVVSEINGVAIRNLRHLVETLRDLKDPYVKFEFAGRYVETLVFDRTETLVAGEDILVHNGIRERQSPDLRGLWEE
jgi:S1-C subfamily serine protease